MAESLVVIYDNLESLIPTSLLKYVDNPQKINIIKLPPIWRGRLGDRYIPSLMVAVCEKNGLQSPSEQQEEENDNWGTAINLHRLRSIKANILTKFDRVLSMLIANETYPCGVEVESYIQTTALRGKISPENFMDVLNKFCKN